MLKSMTRRAAMAGTAVGAALVAGSALNLKAAAAAATAAGPVIDGADPIFAAIEEYLRAQKAYDDATALRCRLENKHNDPAERIAAEEADDIAGDEELRAAWRLVEVQPTTLAGVAALLAFIGELERERELGMANWSHYEDGEKDGRFYLELVDSLAKSVCALAGVTPAPELCA